MKLATWNVNSIRARWERFADWVRYRAPDVVALQETKVEDSLFPADAVRELGYEVVFHGQKTYNGVAILSRSLPMNAEKGLGDEGIDEQARFLSAQVGDLTIASAYIPNGQEVGSPAFEFKLRWLAALAKWVKAHAGSPLVVMGDFNVAPAPLDVHDPAAWEGQVLFTAEERAALEQVIASGLVDSLRKLRPTDPCFTWWDYRMLAFPKNRGLRIDHVLVTPELLKRAKSIEVDREARKGKQPSDHAPVILELG